ncbi:MAG: hypothetical protein ACM33V_01965 [Chloroflexota bacterium]|nr:hypothetical protein [Anaerolineales bacterium]
MEKHKTTIPRKFILSFLLLSGVCLLTTIALWAAFRANPVMATPIPAPDPLPATDIIYEGAAYLGFINADGSGKTIVRFSISQKTILSAWGQPFIIGDPAVLVVTNGIMIPGDVYVTRPGQIAVDCGWWGMPSPASDGRHILLKTSQGQEKYLPDDCGTGNPPRKVYSGVFGPISADGEYAADFKTGIVENITDPLVIRNLSTGEERIIGDGAFPVWSRDGQWLAYTGSDGIYVTQNSPNAVPRRLVVLEFPHPEIGRKLYTVDTAGLYYPPIASWSPDGKWLVYHEYDVDSNAKYPKQYSIFLVSVETGEITKLVDDGLFPQWRWPVEKP